MFTACLFWRHVFRCADDLPCYSNRYLVSRCCNTEVGDLGPSLVIYHDVTKFYIPMNNPTGVSVIEGAGYLYYNRQHFLCLKTSLFKEKPLEVLARKIFHNYIMCCIIF